MNIDPSVMPQTIDLLHTILLVTTVVFLVMYARKKTVPSSRIDKSPLQQTTDPKISSKQEPDSESQSSSSVSVAEPAPTPATPIIDETSPNSALQLLSLLQQDARFIDFIKEDLTGFSDADVGAAARVVHEGSRKTLDAYFSLIPIRSEDEESRITLNQGFNASEVRLTGNVVGEAPFSGILIHRGWKADEVKLPKSAHGHDARVISPAEVEL